MARPIPARLTAREGRRFALTVGAAFLVLGAVAWWRGHLGLRTGFGVLGSLLLFAGAAIPTRLGPVYRAWMGLAHALSRVTTPLAMGLVYFLVITPAGLVMRLFGRRPLVHRAEAGSYWRRHETDDRAHAMRRQF